MNKDNKEEEYGFIKIKYDKNFNFVKTYRLPMDEVKNDLMNIQKSILYIMQKYIGYDDVLRRGKNAQGSPFSPKDFSAEIGMPYNTYRIHAKKLIELGVIKQGKNLTKELEGKNVIIVNRFICTRGEKMRMDILELFEDTKYKLICESELEDDRNSYNYEKWKNKVMARDSFKCVLCGRSDGIEVHHILPYSDYQENRLDINNGITLCKFCHSAKYKGSFHNIYGTVNNTKEQFEEYVNKCMKHN